MTAEHEQASSYGSPTSRMRPRLVQRSWSLIAVMAAGLQAPVPAFADPKPDAPASLEEEVRLLREENAANRDHIARLEEKLDGVMAARAEDAEAVDRAPPFADDTSVSAAPPGDRWDRYLGENRFVVTGWGAAGYDWAQNANENSFTAVVAPILLFQVSDRVLFEAEPELELGSDDTEVNLEYAQADVFLAPFATLVAGKFLMPFGDFIQQLHPAWINKLVSNPLPYREGEEGGLIPFNDLGAQLRGGLQLLDLEGVDLEYTLFISNGPRFEDDEVGSAFETNNIDMNRGKGFGARLALHPLPLAREYGRLKIGASTYNGTWDEGNNLWFTSWGVDLAYQLEQFELRAEYLQTWREFDGDPTDQRDGWYVQAAYKLARLQIPYLNRMELVARYSGIDQSGIAPATPDEEERLHDPQQVALGANYWITPSVAAKLEYDIDLARGASDDHVIRAQLAVGF